MVVSFQPHCLDLDFEAFVLEPLEYPLVLRCQRETGTPRLPRSARSDAAALCFQGASRHRCRLRISHVFLGFVLEHASVHFHWTNSPSDLDLDALPLEPLEHPLVLLRRREPGPHRLPRPACANPTVLRLLDADDRG